MSIPASFLDELKARITLSAIITRRVSLAKHGSEHKGLCPFHKEKTASFTVNDAKGFYYCFGCGAKGDAVTFVIETEGLTFREAVQRLAAEAGLETPQDSPEALARAAARARLSEALDRAADIYSRTLKEAAEGAAARGYLKTRRISAEAAVRFRLGFAPAGGICRLLRADGFDDELLKACGLLCESGDGRGYDFFRSRLMFPVTGRAGGVIGFGARLLDEAAKAPKYLNTPETLLFKKGGELFGLQLARESARREGLIICVEGYTDVIALYEHGFPAAAPCGTALSALQMEALWRLAPQPMLCFDGDEAGVRASARAAENALPLLRAGRSFIFAEIPGGCDPDQLVRTGGAAAMEAVLERALPVSELLWRQIGATESAASGRTPEGRGRMQERAEGMVPRIEDPLTRGNYARFFKDRIWEAARGAPAKAKAPDAPGARAVSRPAVLLAAAVNHPQTLAEDAAEMLGAVSFDDPALDVLRREITATMADTNSEISSEALAARLREKGCAAALNRILTESLYIHAHFARPGAKAADVRRGWREVWSMMRRADLDRDIDAAQQDIKANYTDAGWAKVRALQAERDRLREEREA